MPLDDESVDAVTFGQAWHWVDPPAASREVARVLRPGGVLGLFWNLRDESVDWVRELGEVMHPSNAELMISQDGVVVSEPFGPAERARRDRPRPAPAPRSRGPAAKARCPRTGTDRGGRAGRGEEQRLLRKR